MSDEVLCAIDGGVAISITGQAELSPVPIDVPGDPSSAAFPLVAALIVPGSEILIENVMLNPRRTGLLVTLEEMGANPGVLGAACVAALFEAS